jgi:hypothetical protein
MERKTGKGVKDREGRERQGRDRKTGKGRERQGRKRKTGKGEKDRGERERQGRERKAGKGEKDREERKRQGNGTENALASDLGTVDSRNSLETRARISRDPPTPSILATCAATAAMMVAALAATSGRNRHLS